MGLVGIAAWVNDLVWPSDGLQGHLTDRQTEFDLIGRISLWLNPKDPSLPIVALISKEDPLPGAALARIPTCWPNFHVPDTLDIPLETTPA
jgi:hypothetical protein